MSGDGRAIREATSADLPALRAIQGSALDEPWPALLRGAIDGPPTVVVIDGDAGSPVGYALLITDDDAAYVAELAVAPAAQDQGYGSTLLAGLLERLEGGVDRVRLTTRADDHGLRAFYGGFGFEAVDRLPDHYEAGDGVLLERVFGE